MVGGLELGGWDVAELVVAATGQVYVSPNLPVIAPAAYPEVVAVAASTPDDEPATWAFAGPEVDVCAPGERVWIADVRGEQQDDGTVVVNRFVGFAHGTSFSCAQVAGVAALWRAFHRGALTSGEYAGVPWARVFRQHLRVTARRPAGWDTSSFGAGIVDVEALLATAPPAAHDVPLPASVVPFNPFVALADLFEGAAEAWDGLLAAAADLGRDLERMGRDAWNEGLVLLGTLAAEGGAMADAAMAFGLRAAERTAREGADLVGDLWQEVEALATAAGGELGRQGGRLAEGLAQAWQDATEAAEDLAEQAAQTAEDTAEAVVAVVEDVAEGAAETGDAVLDFVAGLFG